MPKTVRMQMISFGFFSTSRTGPISPAAAVLPSRNTCLWAAGSRGHRGPKLCFAYSRLNGICAHPQRSPNQMLTGKKERACKFTAFTKQSQTLRDHLGVVSASLLKGKTPRQGKQQATSSCLSCPNESPSRLLTLPPPDPASAFFQR